MALAFPEETLRAVQDPLPFHQALLSEYASVSTADRIPPTLRSALPPEHNNLVEVLPGGNGLARHSSIHHKTGVAFPLLVQRWRLAITVLDDRLEPKFDRITSV